MMKGISKIVVLIVLVVIILAAGVYYVLSSLDRIVAAAIETYGSKVTQTDVTVSSVAIKLKSGEGSIKGLKVGNPSGFSSPEAFTLGDITVDLDTSTITKDVIVIDRLQITGPHVTYEINKSGQANINVINKNVKQLQGESAPAAAPEEEKGESAVKLMIRKLVIEGGQIEVYIPVKPEPLTVKLPKIDVANLGSGGAPPREIASDILSVILKNVGPAVQKVGVEQYLGKNVEEMKGQLQKQMDEKAGEAVKGMSEKAGEAINKFLGK
jgi:hypothetical protein